jgi:hypothetical protein
MSTVDTRFSGCEKSLKFLRIPEIPEITFFFETPEIPSNSRKFIKIPETPRNSGKFLKIPKISKN